MEFYETAMGHRFYQSTMPSIASSLADIAKCLKDGEKSQADHHMTRFAVIRTANFGVKHACKLFPTREYAASYIIKWWNDERTANYGCPDIFVEEKCHEYGPGEEEEYAKLVYQDGGIEELRLVETEVGNPF